MEWLGQDLRRGDFNYLLRMIKNLLQYYFIQNDQNIDWIPIIQKLPFGVMYINMKD